MDRVPLKDKPCPCFGSPVTGEPCVWCEVFESCVRSKGLTVPKFPQQQKELPPPVL